MVLLYYNNSHSSQKVHGILFLFINVLYTFHLLRVVIAGAAYPLSRIVIFVIGVTVDPVSVLVVQAGQAAGRLLAVAEDTLVDDAGEVSVFIIFIQFFLRENLVGRIDKEHIILPLSSYLLTVYPSISPFLLYSLVSVSNPCLL